MARQKLARWHWRENPARTDVAAVFVTQATEPTATDKITVTPNDAIEEVKQAWAAGQGYALAFFQIKNGEPTGGHAVTPVALEDRGEGKVAGIVLYDNNFPKQPQVMVVDTAANTWSYSTAADPRTTRKPTWAGWTTRSNSSR